MKRVDIQELIFHILEEDSDLSFISNYQMYLIQNYLLRRNLFSDFGTDSLIRLMMEYPCDMELVGDGIKIVKIEELHHSMSVNLRFSKSDKMKQLMEEVWSDIKDK